MNIQKKIIISVVFIAGILLLAGIACGVNYLRFRSNANKKMEQMANASNLLKAHIFQQVLYSNLKISKEMKVVNERNEAGQLVELVAKGGVPKVIFRFSESHCIDCILAELNQLKELAGVIGRENVLLLTSWSGSNDLLLFKKNYNVDLPLYNIPADQLAANKIEHLNFPYLFVMDSDFSPVMVFIPEKELPGLSKNYYRLVTTYFEGKNRMSNRELSKKQTVIKFSRTEYDFKNIRKGYRLTYAFTFTNTGAVPLVIKRVKPECGCTEANYPEAPIGPGATGAIRITYIASERGHFVKGVEVFSNTVLSPVTLKITGDVL